MDDQVGASLGEAKLFLKRYANAKIGAKDEKGSQSLLYLSLPLEPSSEANSEQPLREVVHYCTSVLERMRLSLTCEAGAGYELGSVDLKAIDFLIEVVVHATICPILTSGLRPPIRDVLTSSETRFPMASRDIEEEYERLQPFLTDIVAPFNSFQKPGILALLIAGVVELTFHPEAALNSDVLYQGVIRSIAPQRLLPSIQLLLTRSCPRWALAVLTREMTQVLLRPDGLTLITTFILQPDAKGEVPIERFDRLAGLVSAVPSTLSVSAYMAVLAPQIIHLLDDNSSMAQRQRRAAAVILRKLYFNHKESGLITDKFWEPLIVQPGKPEDQKESLQRLSQLTAFEFLRSPILSGYIPELLVLGYHFHESKAISERDQVERLLYRLVEQDFEVSMVPSVAALLDTSSMSSQAISGSFSESDASLSHILSSRVLYILRLVKQLAMDGRPLLKLQSDLFASYANDQTIHCRAQYLELMIEIPAQNTKLFFENVRTLYWLSQATTFFIKYNRQEFHKPRLDELAIVYLNILKLLADEDVKFDLSHLSHIENLIQALRLVSRRPATDLSKVVNAVLQKFELVLLSNKSKSQVDTPAKESNISASKDEVMRKYAAAIQDMSSDMVPIRAHGLYMIGELAKSGTNMDEMRINELLPVMLGLLGEEEAYVHQNGIKAFRKLIDAYGEPFRLLLIQTRDAGRYSRTVVDRINTALGPASDNA